MPMEEVSLEDGECMSLASKRPKREECWYRELATIYPYGLNDNETSEGNLKNVINMKHHTTWTEIQHRLLHLLNDHNNSGLVYELSTLVFSLLQRKPGILIDLANNLLLEQTIPINNLISLK